MITPRRDVPEYAIEDVKRAILLERYLITQSVARGAAILCLDEDDIRNCVLGIKERDFYKSMPSIKRPGLSQDVYKCECAGFAIYLKVQMTRDGRAVVVSFKRDENP